MRAGKDRMNDSKIVYTKLYETKYTLHQICAQRYVF